MCGNITRANIEVMQFHHYILKLYLLCKTTITYMMLYVPVTC